MNVNVFDKTTPMIERHRNLRTLMNFISDLPHDKFHMPNWCGHGATNTSCGTAGCAAGWAISLFHKKGLILSPYVPVLVGTDARGSEAFAEFFGIPFGAACAITQAAGIFNEHNIYYGGILLGSIQSYQKEYGVSVSGSDITPRMAAERIHKVLEMVAPEVLKEENTPCISTEQPQSVSAVNG